MFKFRYMTKVALAFAAALFILSNAQSSMAQSAPATDPASIPILIGVVDVEQVLSSSTAGQALSKQSEALRKQFQADFTAKQKELRAAGDQFNKQRASMTEAQVADAVKKLQDKENAYRKEFETKRKSLDTSFGNARKKIFEALNKAVLDVAQARKLTLVLKKSVIVVSAQAWDITDSVIAQLNKILPSVKM
ncbi:OmpH family outer membrane protein [Dongia sp.]|uniref:OmpH family outer membrane protein n=1 Tax=Dongia sp. TaxID=1977262 RepID=UPI0035B11B13